LNDPESLSKPIIKDLPPAGKPTGIIPPQHKARPSGSALAVEKHDYVKAYQQELKEKQEKLENEKKEKDRKHQQMLDDIKKRKQNFKKE